MQLAATALCHMHRPTPSAPCPADPRKEVRLQFECLAWHALNFCLASGPEGANLFILNLPPDATDDTLRHVFSSFGNVISTLVYKDKLTGMSKQFGSLHRFVLV